MHLFAKILYNSLRSGLCQGIFNTLPSKADFCFQLILKLFAKKICLSLPLKYFIQMPKTIVSFLWNQSKYEYLSHSYFSSDKKLLHAF